LSLVERAEAAQMGYLEFVDLLVDEEVGVRESPRVTNALKLSGLPHHKRLSEFDYSFQPELDPRKIKDLPPWASSASGPTWPCSARPGWARP
jgi:DNA replication protein DnaC